MNLIKSGSKKFKLLDGFKSVFSNFDFSTQGCTVIMGPNGCGKSTLLRILLGLEKLDSGELLFLHRKEELLSTVLQNYKSQLMLRCTLADNILVSLGGCHHPGYNGTDALEIVSDQLRKFGFAISLNSLVGNLSGGEQQAVVVARTFLANPRIWLLDEPVSAIDFKRRGHILEAIASRTGSDMIIMSTHDINDAIFMADKLIVFDQNMQIVFEKDFSEYKKIHFQERLKSEWASEIRKEFTNLTHFLNNS